MDPAIPRSSDPEILTSMIHNYARKNDDDEKELQRFNDPEIQWILLQSSSDSVIERSRNPEIERSLDSMDPEI